jgi:hypothetical protein
MKPVKTCFKKGKKRIRKRKRSGEFDQSILYSCVEMLQWKPFVQLIYPNNKQYKIITIKEEFKWVLVIRAQKHTIKFRGVLLLKIGL